MSATPEQIEILTRAGVRDGYLYEVDERGEVHEIQSRLETCSVRRGRTPLYEERQVCVTPLVRRSPRRPSGPSSLRAESG